MGEIRRRRSSATNFCIFTPGYASDYVAANCDTSVVALPPSNTIVGGLMEITFTSNPVNALVIIGGMALGRTPFTKLPPGLYKASLRSTATRTLWKASQSALVIRPL